MSTFIVNIYEYIIVEFNIRFYKLCRILKLSSTKQGPKTFCVFLYFCVLYVLVLSNSKSKPLNYILFLANGIIVLCFAASPLMGAQSFPNLTTTGTTSTVTMSTSIVTSSNNVATATTGLSVGQLLSNTLTTSLTSTSSESDTGQEAEFSLYGKPC